MRADALTYTHEHAHTYTTHVHADALTYTHEHAHTYTTHTRRHNQVISSNGAADLIDYWVII